MCPSMPLLPTRWFLKVMGSRLCLRTKHDAILLLRHCIATPRVLSLRTAPCVRSPCLEDFDLELRSILSNVLNINLDKDLVWSQAILPVRKWGDWSPQSNTACTIRLFGICCWLLIPHQSDRPRKTPQYPRPGDCRGCPCME